MFTGIVKTTGRVSRVKEKQRVWLTVKPKQALGRLRRGDSVSVSGVCLTIVKKTRAGLTFELMGETIRKTTLGLLKENGLVNLEPALRVGDPLGGHIVQGHVDAVGKITAVKLDKKNVLVSIAIPKELKPFVVTHGSIGLDGISLTVAGLKNNILTVSLTKETSARTTWKNVSVGQTINIEVDIMAKYIANLLKKK